ncbi:MAG: hypothetical protein M5U12_19610 [Verrucomicrobia bacterium]|nr:hypothetical protein [Verrucomicrobiota bacterium]
MFLSGSREADGLTSHGAGIFDLTEDGTRLFLNAVAYLSGPPVTAPVLTVQREGGNLILSWQPTGGTLESSSDLAAWTPVAGATSPVTVPMTAAQAFYRVRQ